MITKRDTGEIFIDDKPLAKCTNDGLRRAIEIVFESLELASTMTARAVVAEMRSRVGSQSGHQYAKTPTP